MAANAKGRGGEEKKQTLTDQGYMSFEAAAAAIAGAYPDGGWRAPLAQPYLDLMLVMFVRDVFSNTEAGREVCFIGTADSAGPVHSVRQMTGNGADRAWVVQANAWHKVPIPDGPDHKHQLRRVAEFVAANRGRLTIGVLETTNHPIAAATRSMLVGTLYATIRRSAQAEKRLLDLGGAHRRWTEVGTPAASGAFRYHLVNPRFGAQAPELRGHTACSCTCPDALGPAGCDACRGFGANVTHVAMVHSAYFTGVRIQAARLLYASAREQRHVQVLGVIDSGLDMVVGEERELHDGDVRVSCARDPDSGEALVYAFTDSRAGEPRYAHPPTVWWTRGYDEFQTVDGRPFRVCYAPLEVRGDSVLFEMKLGDHEPRPLRSARCAPDNPSPENTPAPAIPAETGYLGPRVPWENTSEDNTALFGVVASATGRDPATSRRVLQSGTLRLAHSQAIRLCSETEGLVIPPEVIAAQAAHHLERAAQLIEAGAHRLGRTLAVASEPITASHTAVATGTGSDVVDGHAELTELATGRFDLGLALSAFCGLFSPVSGGRVVNPYRARALQITAWLIPLLALCVMVEEALALLALNTTLSSGGSFWAAVEWGVALFGERRANWSVGIDYPWIDLFSSGGWAWRHAEWELRRGWSYVDIMAFPIALATLETLLERAWPRRVVKYAQDVKPLSERLRTAPVDQRPSLFRVFVLRLVGHLGLCALRYHLWPRTGLLGMEWSPGVSVFDVMSRVTASGWAPPVVMAPMLVHLVWNVAAAYRGLRAHNDTTPLFMRSLNLVEAGLAAIMRKLANMDRIDHGLILRAAVHDVAVCEESCPTCDCPSEFGKGMVNAAAAGRMVCYARKTVPEGLYDMAHPLLYKVMQRGDEFENGLPHRPVPVVLSKRPPYEGGPALPLTCCPKAGTREHKQHYSFLWTVKAPTDYSDIRSQQWGTCQAKCLGLPMMDYHPAIIAPDLAGAFISRALHYPHPSTGAITPSELSHLQVGQNPYAGGLREHGGWVGVTRRFLASLRDYIREMPMGDFGPEPLLDFYEQLAQCDMTQAQKDLLMRGKPDTALAVRSDPGVDRLPLHIATTKRDEIVSASSAPTFVDHDAGAAYGLPRGTAFINCGFSPNPQDPFDAPVYKKNRLIVPSPPVVGCQLLRYIKALERWALRAFDGNGPLVYAPGLTVLQLGALHTKQVRAGVQWVWEYDGSNWDWYQNRGCQAFIYALVELFTLVTDDHELAECARVLLMPVRLATPNSADGFRILLQGWFEPSGRFTTTVANTIRNLLAQWWAFGKQGLMQAAVSQLFLAGGDDMLNYEVPHGRGGNEQEIREVFTSFFGRMPVTGGRKTIRTATFCSKLAWPCKPVPTSHGIAEFVWAPLVGRTIYKLGCTFMEGRPERVYATLAVNYGQLINYYAVVPFLRVYVKHYARVFARLAGGAVPYRVRRSWTSILASDVTSDLRPSHDGETFTTFRAYYGAEHDWPGLETRLDNLLALWEGGECSLDDWIANEGERAASADDGDSDSSGPLDIDRMEATYAEWRAAFETIMRAEEHNAFGVDHEGDGHWALAWDPEHYVIDDGADFDRSGVGVYRVTDDDHG